MKIYSIIVIYLLIISMNGAKANKNIMFGNSRKLQKTIQSETHFGGDMLGIAPKQKGVLRQPSSFRNKIWPNGVIFYKIAKNAFTSSELQIIKKGMQNIESNTCIRFKKRTHERDYINIRSGNGCFSYCGRVGGPQDVSFGSGCVYVGTIVHELMHAIGFYHEHMRADRDSFLIINWNNIEPGLRSQFEKVPANQNHLYAKFDYNSIMIYSSNAFSKNGKNTMTPKKKKIRLSNPYDKSGLTSIDIITVKKMYKC